MKKNKIFPTRLRNEVISVAVRDPFDVYTLDSIRLVTGLGLHLFLVGKKEILEAIDQYYGVGAITMEKIIEDMAGEEMSSSYETEEDVERLKNIASEAPIIRLANLIISKAVEKDASDVHFEPYEDSLYVRYRIDGILLEADSSPKEAPGGNYFPYQKSLLC